MRIFWNIDRLGRDAWLLLLISGLFITATSLSNSFVNVYLWKIKHDLSMISWFNLTHYVVAATTFVLAGWISKRMDRVIAIRLGVAVLSIFYLTVLLLGIKSVQYVILLGAINGIGTGFFWLAFNVLYFEITERGNRDVFNGMNGLIGSTAGILAPIISGWIITRIDHLLGYRIIFGVSLGIFVTAVFVSFFFRARNSSGTYSLFSVLKLVKSRKNHWFWVNFAMIAQGMREGVFAFLIGLLVYETTKNELTLGTFFTVSSVVSLIGFFIVGRFMKQEKRNRFILIGSLMMGIVILPFVFNVSIWTMFIFGIGGAFFYPLYMAPLLATVFDVIGEKNETAKLHVEYVVARELALNLGRVISVLLFVWWIQTSEDVFHIRWFILGVAFVQVFTWVFIHHVPVFKPQKNDLSIQSRRP